MQTSSGQQATLGPARVLRCFVGGQLVGEMTVPDCVQRNGVSTDDPDVSVALAPAAPTESATPVDAPPVQAQPQPLALFDPAPAAAPTQPADCLQYVAPSWRLLGAGMSLSGCAKLLFDGRCARGAAIFTGRWGAQTLRQQAGEIDVSDDDRDFRPLVTQSPPSCRVGDF